MDAVQLGFGQSNKLRDKKVFTMPDCGCYFLRRNSELGGELSPQGARARASTHCGWRMNRVDDGIGGRADRALKFDLEQWLRPWGG